MRKRAAADQREAQQQSRCSAEGKGGEEGGEAARSFHSSMELQEERPLAVRVAVAGLARWLHSSCERAAGALRLGEKSSTHPTENVFLFVPRSSTLEHVARKLFQLVEIQQSDVALLVHGHLLIRPSAELFVDALATGSDHFPEIALRDF